jgi:serine/threonine protein kinase
VRHLGSGGYGQVEEMRCLLPPAAGGQTRVAIKFVRAENTVEWKEAITEVTIHSLLLADAAGRSQDHIVRLIDHWWLPPKEVGLVMQLCSGTLADVFENEKQKGDKELFEFFSVPVGKFLLLLSFFFLLRSNKKI